MISFLRKQIPFNSSFKNQFIITILLGSILALIMIFLEPFDTDGFESDHKYLIFIGFGIVFSFFYLVNSRIERLWFNSRNRTWTVTNEIFAFITLIVISSIPIHFYNQIFLNDLLLRNFVVEQYFEHGLWFFRSALLPIMVLLFPFFIYLRNKLGKISIPDSLEEIELYGVNKGEKIALQKDQVLFVKASENYVEIFYAKNQGVQRETFRNTLGAIKKQAPFLKQCHRSYLVNISNIKNIIGNSKNARIEFHHDNSEIPLSTTYYKRFKSSLRV